METNKLSEIDFKMKELIGIYHQYKKDAEDGPEKRIKLKSMQVKIGKYVKKSVKLSKEEGYTTLEIAKRLDIPESTVRSILEG